MKTQSDKLWDLYKERRLSGLPVSLSVFNNGTESFYYSSNPPKPGAADRQKQRHRQRGCRGHGGRARVEKVAGGAAKATAAAPSYAAVTRTPLSPPQTRPLKRARRPSEANKVTRTT